MPRDAPATPSLTRDGASSCFHVTYDVDATSNAEARQIVDALCLEQTVELPEALVPPGTWINEHVVGKCVSIERCASGVDARGKGASGDVYRAKVRYADDCAGGELPQLVNVIFGNTSIKERVMVRDVELSDAMLREVRGGEVRGEGAEEIARESNADPS